MNDTLNQFNKNLLHLSPITKDNSSKCILRNGEIYNFNTHSEEKKKYHIRHLNKEQLEAWNYINDNPRKMNLLDAFPGSGKTFFNLAVAYNFQKPVNIVCFKNDIIDLFWLCARRFTLAALMMKIFKMSYYTFREFEKQLSYKMTSYEFLLVMISMLKEAELVNFGGSIVIIDEYTVISKPLLCILLMLLKLYGIGCIISGDNNQLPCIHDSEHTSLSSYQLVIQLVEPNIITLSKNQRCADKGYNEIVNFWAKLSSKEKVNNFAFAILVACFPEQCLVEASFDQIHLASTHQEMSEIINILVCKHEIECDFYLIDSSSSKTLKQFQLTMTKAHKNYKKQVDDAKELGLKIIPQVRKFLPYLPLVINCIYYVYKNSEHCKGILKSYDLKKGILVMQMENGKKEYVSKSNNDQVMFDEHRTFLLDETINGRLWGFPIYPAFMVSAHKIQGCTISDKLDLILCNTEYTTYNTIYVAVSRVTDPSKISRLQVLNSIVHLASAIVNFECLIYDRKVTAAELDRVFMQENYIYYDVTDAEEISWLALHIKQFFQSKDITIRKTIRDNFIEWLKNTPKKRLKQSVKRQNVKKECTIEKFIRYQDIFRGLSQIQITINRNVWLHLFMLYFADFKSLLPYDLLISSKLMKDYEPRRSNVIADFAQLHEICPLDCDLIDFLEKKSQRIIRTEEQDIHNHVETCLKVCENNVFLENTSFCCNVYKKLIASEKITIEWLIEQLNMMMSPVKKVIVTTSKNKKRKHLFEAALTTAKHIKHIQHST